ncbi:MAG: SDR family NAD(P)-dependent oxidoreductase [Methylobacteriaceae bacterium]|nr:SDR family NAD(P)-dependent oxidoreductase [Methylobacteriaceae bacterium]
MTTARVALVTGGTGGIGTAIVKRLAALGHKVATNYRDEAKAKAWADGMKAQGVNVALVKGDVATPEAGEAIVRGVEQQIGPIDILINNAGMSAARGLDDITEADFDRTMAVNLKSAFLCTQAVLAGMRARRWGRIVNISSIGARLGSGAVSVAYAAAKAGLEGLMRGYALRLAPDGVTVNAVAPGLVDTDMGRPLIEAGLAARIPIGRVGTGDEIAQTVMLLVRNGYITGQTIAANGGSLFS